MSRFLFRAIEATWLLAAFFIPVTVVQEMHLLPRMDVPRLFIVRTLALVLVTLVIFEWACSGRRGPWLGFLPGSRSSRGRVRTSF